MSIETLNQQENNVAWPVSPSFLVKPVVSRHEKYSPNKHGVYASDTVRGLMADASDDSGIQNPLSLFQVVPGSCTFDDFTYIGEISLNEDTCLGKILKGKKVIRVDPKSLYQKKTCCDKFRKCNGYENKCHEQDCRIALLYHQNLKGIHYTNNFEDYYNVLNKVISEYNRGLTEEHWLHCESDETNRRLYVWYQCPYSNFLEYFFPIIHAGKVIAVLMQGQKIPKELVREKIFQDVLNDSLINPEEKNVLRQSIEDIPDNEFNSDKDPMPKTCLNAIWKRIRSLEERIYNEVMAYSRAYVSDNFHEIEQGFHQQIKEKIKENGELTEKDYKEIVNETLRKICCVFNKNGFIRIYSTESEFEEGKSNTDTFYLIGTSSKLTETEKKEWGKLEFRNLPSDLETLERMKNEDFNPYLKRKIEFHDGVIFRIESLSIGNTKHLVWKGYPNKKGIDQEQFNVFSNFLKTFYHTLWEPYNLLRSVKLRKKLEASMRVSVHETSQIIPVIINTLKKEYNLDSETRIREDGLNFSGITRRTNILYDTIDRLRLLDNLYKRSTLMFKKLEPEKEWTDLHRLIYSVRSLCDEKAKVNNMQKIVVKSVGDFRFNQYQLYTDYQLVSHALFNLVDNAIKYGYMGGIIQINISLSEADLQRERSGYWSLISSIQISVVSYGTEVDKKDEEHIYELFYRSSASKVKEGMGIGLFLVKKICDSLGYTIKYKGSKLSEYNLPIYHHGIKQGKPVPVRSVSQAVINEAVNTELLEKDWYIEDFEFDAAISQPTYRNEFIVTLNKVDNKLIERIGL